MAGHNAQALNYRVLHTVFKAAQEIGKQEFTTSDLIDKVHESLPNLPATSIRTYVLAMSSNHHHPQYFDSLGDGRFRLINQEDPVPTTKIMSTETITKILAAETPTKTIQPKIEKPQIQKPIELPRLETPKPEYINRKPEPLAAIDEPFVWTEKYGFLEKYGNLIAAWAKENRDALLIGRRNYRWQHESLSESIDRRNNLSKLLVLSRIKNNGGVDRQTLDAIMAWGFPNPLFPERNEQKCLDVTKEAFYLLDDGKPAEAVLKLMSINAVGISRATKIIALFDQNNYAIYDSRVGNALKSLRFNGDKIIRCPPGMNRPGDNDCSAKDWAESYQKLLWVLGIIRNELNEQGYPFSIADVEMALFMMGK